MSVDRIDVIASRILNGDIVLPRFQRGFVWNREQILQLLDSVVKGYPIGSILLWKSSEPLHSERRIADLDIELRPKGVPTFYLLDGQQRLSTICGAMYWPGKKDPESHWNLVFDLRTGEFEHLSHLNDPPAHQIRLNKLSTPAEFFKHTYALDSFGGAEAPKLKKNAERLFNSFKDYKLATVTLPDISMSEVAPIFERINSQGTQLTIADLMRAAIWKPEFDPLALIDEILDELEGRGFGEFEEKTILRNVSAASGGTFSHEGIARLRNVETAVLRRAIETTRDAYRATVSFLVEALGVPNGSLLPYANQAVLLAEVFRISSPKPDETKALQRWFWETSVAEYFSGWNTTSMGRDLESARRFAAGATASLSTSDARKSSEEVWRTRPARRTGAVLKAFAILVHRRNPLDILTGKPLSVADAFTSGRPVDFVPLGKLQDSQEGGRRRHAIASVVFASATSAALIRKTGLTQLLDSMSVDPHELASRLAGHFLDDQTLGLLRKGRLDEFVASRAKNIEAAVNQIIARSTD